MAYWLAGPSQNPSLIGRDFAFTGVVLLDFVCFVMHITFVLKPIDNGNLD